MIKTSNIRIFLKDHKIILLIVISFTFLYSYLSISRHNSFQTHANDLGIYDQMIWLYSQFKIPFSTVRQPNINLWGDHFHPILLLFAPLYWIWSDPRLLLICQSVLVCFSVIPLYLIAQKKLQNRIFSLFLSLSYLLFIGLQNAIQFDFHVATISVFFLSWLLYAYHFEKKRLFWLFFALTLICKEDMALVLFMLGFYDLLFKKKVRRGFFIIFITLGTFLFFILGISFRFNPQGDYLSLIFPGSNLLEQIKYMLIHPLQSLQLVISPEIKRETFHLLLSPFFYLPLLSPFFLFLGLPLLGERFFSVFETRWGIGFHYSASIAPLLFVGAVYGICNLFNWMKKMNLEIDKKRILCFLAFIFVFVGFYLTISEKTLLTHLGIKNGQINAQDRQEIQSILDLIPKEASLSAQSALVPHLSHRRQIYYFPYAKEEVEYIILSTELDPFPLEQKELQQAITELSQDQNYLLIQNTGETYLFQKRNKEL